MELPEGICFNDKDGKKGHDIRIKWWDGSLKTYQQASVSEIPSLNNSPDLSLQKGSKISGYPDEDKPVFFGHYWFTGTPERIKENVAYHWNNKDQNINNESFVSHKS